MRNYSKCIALLAVILFISFIPVHHVAKAEQQPQVTKISGKMALHADQSVWVSVK